MKNTEKNKSTGFFKDVYEVVKKIPKGKVATFGQISGILGRPKAAKFVGYALSVCDDSSVPCHRVVNKLGNLNENVFNGIHKEILLKEGITFLENGNINLKKHLYDFPEK